MLNQREFPSSTQSCWPLVMAVLSPFSSREASGPLHMLFLLPRYHFSLSSSHGLFLTAFSSCVISKAFSGHLYKRVILVYHSILLQSSSWHLSGLILSSSWVIYPWSASYDQPKWKDAASIQGCIPRAFNRAQHKACALWASGASAVPDIIFPLNPLVSSTSALTAQILSLKDEGEGKGSSSLSITPSSY